MKTAKAFLPSGTAPRPNLSSALLSLSLLFLPVMAVSDSGDPLVLQDATIASVTVAYVKQADMIGRVPISGTLVARDEILVYPQVNGFAIDELRVDIGDSVAAGDILAMLNARTLQAQLAQSQAELARTRASINQAQSQITAASANATQTSSSLKRAIQLRENGTATQAALDQAVATSQTADADLASANDGLVVAQAQALTAQAQLDIANLNLENATIRAPAAGLISARSGQIGAITASAGEPIFRIITGGVIEVEAEVIETALGEIDPGDIAMLNIAGNGDVSGTVRRISPTVDAVNRLGLIRIDVGAATGLRTGVFASGWVITQERRALTVPTAALLTDTEGTFVLVVNDGMLEKRPVVAGLIWNGLREIVSGIVADEVVVAKAGAFFGDGDTINPIFPELTSVEGASK